MNQPQIIKPSLTKAQFAGMVYQVSPETVSVLNIELGQGFIYFVSSNLFWKDAQVQVSQKNLSNEYKRKVGKKTLGMVQAKGPGNIALSFGQEGTIIPIFLKAYESIDIKEYQFLAATDNVEFASVKMQKVSDMFLEGGGTFIDTCTCHQGEGLVWLYGLGQASEIMLSEGQQIDVKADNWIYKNKSVKMEMLFGDSSLQLMLNRFTGPGKVGLQTTSLIQA